MINNEIDGIFKIVIAGDKAVKTMILNTYFQNKEQFCEDVFCKIIKINNEIIKIIVWNLEFSENKFRKLLPKYYQHTKGFFFVYDISNKDTFISIDSVIQETKKKCDDPTIIIVGNQIGQDRKVTFEEGTAKSECYNASFIEVSTNDKKCIDLAFDIIINELMSKDDNEYENTIELEINKLYKFYC